MTVWFFQLSFSEFLTILTIANISMYVGSCSIVAVLQRRFRHRLLNKAAVRNAPGDVALSLLIVAINIGVGIPGWWLWKSGFITLYDADLIWTTIDFLVLVGYFDLVMYLLHRLMHVSWLYTTIHAKHHQYLDVNGLSFFVMNPLEALGFGFLLIAVLGVKPFAFMGLIAFLSLNWFYGTMGHSGLRFESRLLRWLVGDSAFHHRHHQFRQGNYGFFTPLWDKLFRTEV